MAVDRLAEYPKIKASVSGHDLTFVFGGAERLALLLDTIAQARVSLQLYFYCFAADAAGRRVADALIDARNRGVRVTLLVDGFGTPAQPYDMYDAMIEAGIDFARFEARYGRRYLLRNHQKMLIADARVAIVGGSNIEEAYFADDPGGESWHDVYVRVEGEAAARLAAYHDALRDWMLRPGARMRALVAILSRHSDSEGALRWLFGGPSRRLSTLSRVLREAIAAASQIDMIQAYFAPSWGFLHKLGKVARRGRFRLICAARSDNNTTIAAARHCYRRLLRNSAEIYEYRRSRLHMKLIIIDDVTYVGSANFDMRSLYLNSEIMLRIDDAALAAQLRETVDLHCAHSQLITREQHRAASSPLRRARWWLGYWIVTAIDYRLTRRLNWKAD